MFFTLNYGLKTRKLISLFFFSDVDSGPRELELPLTFEVVDGGTKRQKKKLVSSHGYSYGVKRRRVNATDWLCTYRPKENPCSATVVERNGQFFQGINSHNHPAQPGLLTAVKVTASVKQKAVGDIFKPAPAIVDDVLVQQLNNAPCEGLPKPESIARTANRCRQKLRPADPTDLNFTVNSDYLPDDFLRSDLRVRDNRHLVMATDQHNS